MNKKFFSVVLVLLSVLTALAGCSVGDRTYEKKEKIIKERGVVSASPEGYRYDVFTDDTIEISDCNEGRLSTTLIIPEKLDGKKVTSIGEEAFWYTSLTSIDIPASVTSIGDRAFFACTSLTSIDIPASVTSIGEGTFLMCRLLESIELPPSVTSIGDSAFSSCYSLTSIELPSSVTSIGFKAFDECDLLSEAIVPYKLNYCGANIFPKQTKIKDHNGNDRPLYTTSGDYEYVILNQSYTVLAGYTGKSENVSVPGQLDGLTVTSIGEDVFRGCSSLTSIEIPSSVSSIGKGAFHGCCSLTSIEIPSSVSSIGEDVFRGCSSLTSIEIPSSVTSIRRNTFLGCRSLESIVIPSSVTSIWDDKEHAYGVFANCDSLKTVYFGGTEAQWKKITHNVCLGKLSPRQDKFVVVFGNK